MAEMTESQIITELNSIDTELQAIRATLGSTGTGGVQFTRYRIGDKEVDGGERIKWLLEMRKHFQGLLQQIPKVIISDHGYEVTDFTGEKKFDLVGDE